MIHVFISHSLEEETFMSQHPQQKVLRLTLIVLV